MGHDGESYKYDPKDLTSVVDGMIAELENLKDMGVLYDYEVVPPVGTRFIVEVEVGRKFVLSFDGITFFLAGTGAVLLAANRMIGDMFGRINKYGWMN